MDGSVLKGASIARVARAAQPFGAAVLAFVPAPVRRRPGASFDPAAPVLGRIGTLEVRLARSKAEVKTAQQLRFRVFYEEMSAKASPVQRLTRRDRDGFDRFCDHLLVIDRSRGSGLAGQIVGTYRLMRQEAAALAGGFYTAGEFEIDALVSRHPNKRFLELGRSCVMKNYRGKRTVELLWQGIWAYVVTHRIDVLFGCASLAGTRLEELAPSLALLRDHAAAPAEWRVAAISSRRVPLGGHAAAQDVRTAFAALPPLLKGYLRVGGFVGDGAVVDRQFDTTDVLIVLPVENINPRYVTHYGADAKRFAA